MIRRFFLCTITLFALSFMSAAQAAEVAEPAVAAPTSLTAPTSTPQPPSPSITVQPHRAVYKMSLASVKNGSTVTDVSGKMMFEWSDACDGWAVQQHLQLHFSYAEGDDSDVNSTVISWESKDGKRYNFNVRRVTYGKETENYRGKAMLDEKGGSGVYEIPKDKLVKLSSASMFPSTHTALILEQAAAGEKLFTRFVFDGSDEEGAADISAFIGARQGRMQQAGMSNELKNNALLDQAAWPIRLAFYKPNSETGEPDYEMDLTLQANGIARFMQIDYGDFSVSGTLTDLEALPGSGC